VQDKTREAKTRQETRKDKKTRQAKRRDEERRDKKRRDKKRKQDKKCNAFRQRKQIPGSKYVKRVLLAGVVRLKAPVP
jgi:hypothetical protein